MEQKDRPTRASGLQEKLVDVWDRLPPAILDDILPTLPQEIRDLPSAFNKRGPNDTRPLLESNISFQNAVREYQFVRGMEMTDFPRPLPQQHFCRNPALPEGEGGASDPNNEPNDAYLEIGQLRTRENTDTMNLRASAMLNAGLSRAQQKAPLRFGSQQPPTTNDNFVPGHLLRFSQIQVRIDASRGWISKSGIPPLQPKQEEQPDFTTYAGITNDSALPCARKNKKTGDYTDIWYPNDAVFLCLDESRLFIFRDSRGIPVSKEHVQLEEQWSSREAIIREIKRLRNERLSWITMNKAKRLKEMSDWRRRVREWEADFLQQEWFARANDIIFPPGTTDFMVSKAIVDLHAQNKVEDRGAFPVECIGRTRAFEIRQYCV
ncbi:hypothetical protein MferCBS31731_001680 [Microsporum ferrugineum]